MKCKQLYSFLLIQVKELSQSLEVSGFLFFWGGGLYVLSLLLKLGSNCFTILCQFLLYNKVNQLYVYIYPLPLEPPSHLQRILSIQVTTVVQTNLLAGQEWGHRCREQMCGCAEGMNWEFGVDIRALPCVTQIANVHCKQHSSMLWSLRS